MRRDNRRVDNRGMTLVELLLAVTILAIIVVPLLHAFVSSARINRKSKLNQKVTTLGQDIMEGLKAYSAEDLAYEFDYPGGCTEHPSGFQLIKPSMIDATGGVTGNVYELSLKAGSTDKLELCPAADRAITVNGSEKKFNAATGETRDSNAGTNGRARYYAISNVSAEKSTDKTYKTDVIIKIDPVKFTGKTGGVSNNEAKHNDNPLADLYSMDTTHDAFYLEDGAQIMTALADLKAAGAASTIKSSNMCRHITITVAPDASNLYKEVSFKIKYIADSRDTEFPKSALSVAKYEELKNVYLFYVPSYDTTYGNDIIEYENKTDADINLYLVKRQVTAEDGLDYSYNSYTALNSVDAGYKCDVKLKDSGTGKTELRTNVDTNLAMFLMNKTDPGYDANKLMSRSPSSQVTFTYNGTTDNTDGVIRNSVDGKKYEDRIYDVTIDIYEAGTISSILSGDGSIPADKHLVTVRGNMN